VRFATPLGELVPERRSSSVTAVLHQMAGAAPFRVTWVAPSTSDADVQAMRRGLFRDLADTLGYCCNAVYVPEQEYNEYYYDAGVEIIWSAWHGIYDDVPVRCDTERPLASLAAYARVNQKLSSRVAQVAAPGATVAVQDYQLMLAPAMIRDLRPDTRIVHFSHTPFPDLESVARLPSTIVGRLVTGMLGADLLGFQSNRWARRFLRCCFRLGLDVDQSRGQVRHGGRRTWVRSYPVGVDIRRLTDHAQSPQVRRWSGRNGAEGSCRTVVRVDRLDPSKNALRGFEAYSLLLHRHPALARDLRFVACLVPSRERLPAYRRYAEKVWRVIDDVNGRHPGSITVHYGDDRDRALGLMQGYDVLLVNPVADGMNLVAQEGPVVNGREGVVVLSRGAGSSDLLTGAVILERPKDVAATADALDVALSLDAAGRRDRAERMRAAIGRLSPAEWLDHQLADVAAVTCGSVPSCRPPSTETAP
jgi:trehalose 6-phosphate synthase